MPKFRIGYLFPVIIVPFLLMVFLTPNGEDDIKPVRKVQTETKPAKPAPDPYAEAQKDAERIAAEGAARRARERAATTPEARIITRPAAGRCEDVTSYDDNWDNDMKCTRSDGSIFYTDYDGAERFARERAAMTPEARIITRPAAGRCEDVTSYDDNWDNDMKCTRSDGSIFYTDYDGAERFARERAAMTPEERIITRPAGTCEDVTSYDDNWDNDMKCTRSDGSIFYTDYDGAERFESNGDE